MFDYKLYITYADDYAILSNSENNMNLMLDIALDISEELGLHFNLEKYKTLSFIKCLHVKKSFLLDNKVISS